MKQRIHSWIFVADPFKNTGAAWSLLEGKMIFFYVITVIVSVVIIYLLIKIIKSIWYSVGLSFVLAGAIGNFIDRVRLGYVVDMLQTDFMNFPILMLQMVR